MVLLSAIPVNCHEYSWQIRAEFGLLWRSKAVKIWGEVFIPTYSLPRTCLQTSTKSCHTVVECGFAFFSCDRQPMCLEGAQKWGGFMPKVVPTSHGTLVVFRAAHTVMGARIGGEKSILREYHRILFTCVASSEHFSNPGWSCIAVLAFWKDWTNAGFGIMNFLTLSKGGLSWFLALGFWFF